MSKTISQLSSTQFEIFLIVAKKQSITSAAKCLNISKAAVSQAVKSLENALGIPLLNRSTRKISLTHEGELLADQCSRIKYELDIAREMICTMHKKPSGKMKISCSPKFVDGYLIPRLKTYREKFPDVQIETLITERKINLKREQIDFSLGMHSAVLTDDTVAKPICRTHYTLCATPTYIAKHGKPENLSDIVNHNYIAHAGRNDREFIATNEGTAAVNTVITGDHISFIKACVLADLGISKFHYYTVQKAIEDGKLIEILPKEFNKCFDLFIYYQKHLFVQPKVKELVKLFLTPDMTLK